MTFDMRSYIRERRARAVKSGMCSTCCTRPAIPDRRSCTGCRDSLRRRVAARQAARKCVSCERPARRRARTCEVHLKGRNQAHARLKREVFDHYGGKCACCAVAELDFLTIDHVHGGGGRHRRRLFGNRNMGGVHFYRWLKKKAYPPGFQALCFNCNVSKHIRKGACIHEVRAKFPLLAPREVVA